MRIWALQVVGIFALALGVGACTVKETEAPAVSGPSELALSMNLHATPDLVYQDGTSQSAITIEALGPTSQPVRGASFRVDMRVNGTAGDFGTLSTRTLV